MGARREHAGPGTMAVVERHLVVRIRNSVSETNRVTSVDFYTATRDGK